MLYLHQSAVVDYGGESCILFHSANALIAVSAIHLPAPLQGARGGSSLHGLKPEPIQISQKRHP
jgi:hypothetical protein